MTLAHQNPIFELTLSESACTVQFVDLHVGFFSVLAGLLLAIFNYKLAYSTEKLWISGNEAREASERAFVFLDGFESELATAGDSKERDAEHLPERFKNHPDLLITYFAVQPKWKNSGSTPTRNMSIRVNWNQTDGLIAPEYVYKTPSAPLFIAPKATTPSEVFEIPPVGALVEYGLKPVGTEPLVLIWGRGDYEDVFGKKHFVEWCFRVRLDRHDGRKLRATFIQWGPYNRSDHDRA